MPFYCHMVQLVGEEGPNWAICPLQRHGWVQKLEGAKLPGSQRKELPTTSEGHVKGMRLTHSACGNGGREGGARKEESQAIKGEDIQDGRRRDNSESN